VGPGAMAEFSFVVPACAPGSTLQVTSMDGANLNVPLPSNAKPGDTITMKQLPDQRWAVSQVHPTTELAADLGGAEAVHVQLETTKGPIALRIVPAWAPLGARRFLELVDDGHFSNVAVYRALPDVLVQFGVVKAGSRAAYEAIPDDPCVGVPTREGSVIFAARGPNTRTSTLVIFTRDYQSLEKNPWETPIGMVSPGSMATLRSLYTGYGDIPQCGGRGPDPSTLAELGNEYIASYFPQCDFVVKAWRGAEAGQLAPTPPPPASSSAPPSRVGSGGGDEDRRIPLIHRGLSNISKEAIYALTSTEHKLMEIETRVGEIAKQVRTGPSHTELVGLRTELATLESHAKQLEGKEVDDVYTGDLHSGKQMAKNAKKDMLGRLEKMFSLMEETFAEIKRLGA